LETLSQEFGILFGEVLSPELDDMWRIQQTLERKRKLFLGNYRSFVEVCEYFVQKTVIDVEFPFIRVAKIHIHQNVNTPPMKSLLAYTSQFILNTTEWNTSVIPIQETMVESSDADL
jgi:hypothetical protein